MLQVSVAVAVGVGSVACSVRMKRRKMEGAHRHTVTCYIAKDSLPMYTVEQMLFLPLKDLMNFAACY